MRALYGVIPVLNIMGVICNRQSNETNGFFAQGQFFYVKKSLAISAAAELARRGLRLRTSSNILAVRH